LESPVFHQKILFSPRLKITFSFEDFFDLTNRIAAWTGTTRFSAISSLSRTALDKAEGQNFSGATEREIIGVMPTQKKDSGRNEPTNRVISK
jgi:hypothetical protein